MGKMLKQFKQQITQLRLAIAFMTLLPTAPKLKASKENWGRSIKYFTLVGFIYAFLHFVLIKFFQLSGTSLKIDFFMNKAWLVATSLVLGQIFLSGALHFEGLMDSFDGIAASKDNYEDSRKIMLDSHIGSFAALAGMIALFTKIIFTKEIFSALHNTIYIQEHMALITALVMLVPVISRSLIVFIISFQASEALGLKRKASHMFLEFIDKKFDTALSLTMLIWAFILVVLINNCFQHMLLIALFIVINAILGYVVSLWLGKKLHGHDGDTYGAGIEITEIIGLLLINFFI